MSNSLFDLWPFSKAKGNPFLQELIYAISEHVDLNKRGDRNGTPLMLAAKFDVGEAVDKLIERGADMDAIDHDGWTALHFAATLGNQSSCEILLRKGANPNVQNKYGYTPLMTTGKYGQYEIFKLLLESSADTKISNKIGKTVLDYADPNCSELIRNRAHEAKVKSRNENLFLFLLKK